MGLEQHPALLADAEAALRTYARTFPSASPPSAAGAKLTRGRGPKASFIHPHFKVLDRIVQARLDLLSAVAVVAVASWSPPVLAQAPSTANAPSVTGAATAPSAADPAPEVQSQYRDVVARAVAEFDAGRWAEARALFLRAHELWPSARTFRTLGMTSFELRAYAQALKELQAALDDTRRPLPEDHRAQVGALIEQTRAFVGRYQVQLTPAGAQLRVDGVPVVLAADATLVLEVGRHELRAQAAGYSELMSRVDVQGREDQPLVLELQPEAAAPALSVAAPAALQPARSDAANDVIDHHAKPRLWTWIAAGTAVAVAGTSTALWLVSDAKYDAQHDKCFAGGMQGCAPGSIPSSTTSAIKNTQTASQVSAVLAGVAGATAVTLFFVEGSANEESLAVGAGPGGVFARGQF